MYAILDSRYLRRKPALRIEDSPLMAKGRSAAGPRLALAT